MLNKEKFLLLLDKYVSDKISAEERSEFFEYVATGKYDSLLTDQIENNLQTNNTAGTGLPPHRAADILHKILGAEKQNAGLIPKKSTKTIVLRWALAAAVIAIIIFSAHFADLLTNNNNATNTAFAKELTEKINTSNQPLKIEMEEGSIITLQPGSAIHYPVHFLKEKREVFLDGEAFFEVSKNASRPFFVYNKNIVTHVLGTSFNVKINKETQQVEVAVRTGRVEVYENKTLAKTQAEKRDNGVILLPNQKVIYYQNTRQFVPSLVDIPLPVIDEANDKKNLPSNFIFEETPLKKVLENLEKSYGIEIMVEKENLYKCLFTGDVSRQDLYTRLDIICQSVQASYEVKGTKILIKGAGCN